MTDGSQKLTLIKIFRVLLAALVLGTVFLLPATGRAVTLPTTTCDSQQAAAAHLTSDTTPEDGTKAFAYGENNNFVSRTDNLITFNVNLLFNQSGATTIKAFFMDQHCAIAAAPSFGGTFPQATILTYSFDTDLFAVVNQPDSPDTRTTRVFPNSMPKYIWIEVWDGVRDSGMASYSYLVDTDDIQNPIGEPPAPSEPSGPRPVLIIPGIMGSELYDGNDFIWPNTFLLADKVHDYFLLDSLSMDKDGNTLKNITLGDIVKEVPTVDTFKTFINTLISNNYTLNTTYFTLPYDWRLNIDNSVELLKNKIDEIKNQTGFFKVDIVAHSMGGLLTEDYIKQYGAADINKLIFVGTPHLGAPKSAKVLLSGDTDIQFNILDKSTIKQLSLNSPSAYELLPSPDYFSTYQGYITLLGTNNTILNFNTTEHFLENKNLNLNLLTQADDFYAKNLNQLNYGDIKVYNIAGCGLETQSAYSFWPDQDKILSIGYGSGDGTVPLTSSDYIQANTLVKYYVKRVKHATLPSNIDVRQLILGILSDNVALTANVSTSSNFCNFTGRQLTWKSPVEVHIYDQFGNHVGPTADGGFENNIVGVDYEIIDGEKFIYIPSDDGNTYTIQGVGEDTGTFDLVISEIDSGNVTSSAIYNDVGITSASHITVDTTQPEPSVQLDFEGEGSFVDLSSNSNISGGAINDRVPPVTNASQTTPSFGPKEITLSASDDNSGVLNTNYSLDGTHYHIYEEPITIDRAGDTTIYYYSVDKAGNDETIKTEDVIVKSLSGGGGGISPAIVITPPAAPEIDGQVLGEQIEQPEVPPVRNHALVLDTTDNRTVYIIGQDGKKYGFVSDQIFAALGYSFDKIVEADASTYELGGLIAVNQAAHPNGSVILNGGIIWYIHDGERSAFPSMEIFQSSGFNLNQVAPAYEFDMNLQEGEIIKN